jgi:DNA-binding NarL/FixJ family response regulator
VGGGTWARNFDEATSAFSATAFSAVIVDVFLPGRSGFDVLVALRATDPVTPAMVLTGGFEHAGALRACELGAQYVGKPITTEALGGFLLGTRRLSGREREVVVRLRRGQSTKAIAFDLGVAEVSVRVLLHRAEAKLGARNRGDLLEGTGWGGLSGMKCP